MTDAMTPVANDDPMMVAWNAYKAGDEFANTKKWALTIAPMVQVGTPNADRVRACEIMNIEQRERNVDSSLWAAFAAGFAAANGKMVV